MANKFTKKVWTDRVSATPMRRRLVATGITDVWDIEKVEGQVTEIGNAYDAVNMNDIENRVFNGFDILDDTDIKVVDAGNIFTATKLDGVLTELFQYAANGKTAIANAIGGISSSSTFQVLANAITAIKTTLTNLQTEVANGKTAISNAIGATKSGTMSTSLDFNGISTFISDNTKSYYTGTVALPLISTTGSITSYRVNVNFGFTPTEIYVKSVSTSMRNYVNFYQLGRSAISNRYARPVVLDTVSFMLGIDNVSSSGFDIWLNAPSNFEFSISGATYEFIAVG